MARRYRTKPIDPALAHVIRRAPDGLWELATHYGHVLTRGTEADVRAYFAWHCPGDY